MTFPRPLSQIEKAVAWNLLDGASAPELDVLAEQLDAAVATLRVWVSDDRHGRQCDAGDADLVLGQACCHRRHRLG